MTPYIGQFLLNLAALAALLPLLLPAQITTLKRLYSVQIVCLVAAFLWLIKAHITSDFSLINVFSHSHTQKPLLYKIAGTWGNHEGSMLLWVMLLGVFGLDSLRRKALETEVQQTRIILHSCLNLLFIAFILLVCDPFEAAAIPAAEGRDLNPLLQDPLLAIHPPFLYAGYVGFVVVFIDVISVIFHQVPASIWLPQLRSRVLLPWTLLSIGLGLGTFWAYYELGWGGWWFWDPVENTALIPWLLGLLLLHALLYGAHQEQTTRLVVVLSILTFMSSLAGTLLVRSGLLTSVHSFAVDPERGLLLLGLVVSVLSGSVALVYSKFPPSLPTTSGFINRSALVRTSILLTFAALFTLVFGTLYPLLSSAIGYPITVGAPYFQMTFIPMVLPVLCLLPFIPWVGWGQGNMTTTLGKALPSLTISGFLVILLWHVGEIRTIKEIGFSWVALWVITSTLLSLRLVNLTWRFMGMSLAHMGIGVAILGMVLSSATEQEQVKALKIGEKLQIAGMTLKLDEINAIEGPNYVAQQAKLSLSRSDKVIAMLLPEKRFYWTQGIIHGETAIYSGLLSHIYVALGEQYEGDIWSLRLYSKPHINLLWLGMILIAGAGVMLIATHRGVVSLLLLLIMQASSMAMEAHELILDPVAEKRAMHVGRMILCPSCAGQNINDSVAEEAQTMRSQVRQLIGQGLSDPEILDYFIERHGERILYQPAFKLSNAALWGMPWLIFMICGLIAWRRYNNFLNSPPSK
ncbi:cytochrome c-type biogenesis CcmF C-terminal domain-containing protein [Candidatus Paracaedibacter symbiosus]|uniref:cytochrome c-type biogenesis CcmF C-terminal domain-containing protein n=1 Tax=Candidatus Paracaedibacter symbiosus TaxID=244582 RepID=UPI00068A00A4|nr:cytochrome c-type biogenesis CcmF C-terminal domain-containing protein [Candidatus Paracaedibacter symbiosus]